LESMATDPDESERDVIGNAHSPYLLTDEAARYLRFDRAPNGQTREPSEMMNLFRKWAARWRVPVARRGRTLLYDRRVLDAFVKGETWTKRRT